MYTLIFMSSRGNSVRQHTISHGRVLFLSLVVFIVCLAAIGGIGYGLFQKRQSINAEKKLQANQEEIQQLMQAKLQAESELAIINEEMKDIRHMTKTIQEALGILGQGGGDSTLWESEGTEEQTVAQQENAEATTDATTHEGEMQKPLTPRILKEEMLPSTTMPARPKNKLMDTLRFCRCSSNRKTGRNSISGIPLRLDGVPTH